MGREPDHPAALRERSAGRAEILGHDHSVLPDWLEGEPAHAVWMPFLKNGWATLESTAALIDHALHLGLRVLVHCEEGCERAPLTVVWFLHRRRGMTLEEAYTLMRRQRPIVEDRRRWLGIYNR
jgi:protein-tyrosine phosphatase